MVVEFMTFEEAGTVFVGAACSLYFLRKAKVKPGERVLVHGASGGPPEVVEVREVPTPTPADNDVLVRIRASSVCFGDRMFRSGPLLIRLLTLLRPKHQILGVDLAGTVEAVGRAVTRFAPGDEVYGARGERFAAHAEFACVAEDGFLARKPAIACRDGGPHGWSRIRRPATANAMKAPASTASTPPIRISAGPWVVCQSRTARARSTPKKGVASPATHTTAPRVRRVLGARETRATNINTSPMPTRRAATA
jgi:NADPH:quinone reductase-like Zn-dependent oxidoreductase